MINPPKTLQEAHTRARAVLRDGLLGKMRDLTPGAGSEESGVRRALRLLSATGYKGPGRSVLEWAVDRAVGGVGAPEDWDVAAALALRYLALDIDPAPGFRADLVATAAQAVRAVNERHQLTSVDAREGAR